MQKSNAIPPSYALKLSRDVKLKLEQFLGG